MRIEIKGSPWDWTAMILAAVALILVIVNAWLVVRNEQVQLEVSQRQQVINQGLQYARLRQILAQALAQVAVAKSDRDLSDLLARHGIAINTLPAAASTPAGK